MATAVRTQFNGATALKPLEMRSKTSSFARRRFSAVAFAPARALLPTGPQTREGKPSRGLIIVTRASEPSASEISQVSEVVAAGPSSVAEGAPQAIYSHGTTLGPVATVSLIGLNPLPLIPRLILPLAARISGPVAVIITCFSAVAALFAFISGKRRSQTANCTSCRAYGVKRCHLCKGDGTINWEGKFSHSMACPVCLGKRFESCQDCGGKSPRSLFKHRRGPPLGSLVNAPPRAESDKPKKYKVKRVFREFYD